MGIPCILNRRAVITRAINGRPACHYCGQCGRGCVTGSNYSASQTQIFPALATGRLEVLDLAMARAVTTRENGEVDGVVYVDKRTGRERRVRCRVLVLAASACESARLLLNSKTAEHPDGVGNSSGVVGRYLMDTVGFDLGGTVPALEGLPRYNSDGAGGNHLYMPWWGWEPGARPSTSPRRCGAATSKRPRQRRRPGARGSGNRDDDRRSGGDAPRGAAAVGAGAHRGGDRGVRRRGGAGRPCPGGRGAGAGGRLLAGGARRAPVPDGHPARRADRAGRRGGRERREAGAPEFIDLLCSRNPDLLRIYADGLARFDAASRRAHGRTFVDASDAQQRALLDGLVAAERGEPAPPDLQAGRGFFNWIRRMTVDACYTSPIGIADVGFLGNRVLGGYETPREAVEFVARKADELGR